MSDLQDERRNKQLKGDGATEDNGLCRGKRREWIIANRRRRRPTGLESHSFVKGG